MKRTLIIGSLILLLLLSGCTEPPKGTTPGDTAGLPVKTAPPPEQTAIVLPMAETVLIDEFFFSPPTVVIARGGTVTWRNKDSDKHTVIGDGFESKELSQGQTFQHKFDEIGVYKYKCRIHPSMSGEIIVK